MRLDNYLVEAKYCKSREKAKMLILEGKVSLGDRLILKPSFELPIDLQDFLVVDKSELFVSRGAQKLLGYLQTNQIDCLDKHVLDVGSSTGGFAQVLLEKGARKVTCVDVGKDQLDLDLRRNPKIRLFEQCDIRDFFSQEIFDFIVCDISFISLSKILDALVRLGNEFILLFKPQFEVGRDVKRNKKGVIFDKLAIKTRLDNFLNELENKKLKVFDVKKSVLKGKEGNEEFFIYAKKF
ncbi:TlyA family RNA methyltransferase [Helicobacter sp. 13S00477-4]|uniref:23S rRNA (cytidine-2'-O)-methyltransferase TlyA n=1 Tax=Helicobacter sp. 13S00477-4 TaxID=1905759 RepID=UPI000BA6369A|nr:TlyA family RNA methyltransferase [Helicobacter sp. 13S00477-4]PAF52766.1 hypothetical protein BKH44_00860 [Helicobacter sp. 13S00477-4]